MMYADIKGNIGQVMAVRLPIRSNGTPPDLIRDPADASSEWRRLADATQLPYAYNPSRGWLGSANNKPTETPFPIGYFFSPGDRMERMATLLGGDKRIGVAELQALQQDVYMSSAVALRDAVVAAIDELHIADESGLVARIRGWDGHYRKDSTGAVAFEMFFHHFKDAMYARRHGPRGGAQLHLRRRREAASGRGCARGRQGAARRRVDRTALKKAVPDAAKFASWGEMHRLGLAHVLGNIPVIGSRYRFADHPVGGSTDTLMKTSAASSTERHFTRYGSQARHVSDLSDPDRNFFLLLGGQDGWLNSSTFLDQMPNWLEGRYIQVPMRPETARALFKRAMTLTPG